MDKAADEGVIFNGAIIKQLTAIIRELVAEVEYLQRPSLFSEANRE